MRERIGKTQGMTFRINPPRKAKSKVSGRREVEVEGGVKGMEIRRARWPAVSQGFSATRIPVRRAGSFVFGFKGRVSWCLDFVWVVGAGWNSSSQSPSSGKKVREPRGEEFGMVRRREDGEGVERICWVGRVMGSSSRSWSKSRLRSGFGLGCGVRKRERVADAGRQVSRQISQSTAASMGIF